MLVKTITADASGPGVLEDLLFAIDRIELRGYTGVTKRVVNDSPSDNLIISFNRKIYAGVIRVKGIITIPSNRQEQDINFFISPNDAGARPWEVTVIGEKSQGENTIERVNFDTVFRLPPATVGLRTKGIIANFMTREFTASLSNTRRQSQQSTMTDNRGRDIIL